MKIGLHIATPLAASLTMHVNDVCGIALHAWSLWDYVKISWLRLILNSRVAARRGAARWVEIFGNFYKIACMVVLCLSVSLSNSLNKQTVTGDLWAWIIKVRSNSIVIFITFHLLKEIYTIQLKKTFTLVLPPRSYLLARMHAFCDPIPNLTCPQRKRVQLRSRKFSSTHVERYFEDTLLSSSDENIYQVDKRTVSQVGIPPHREPNACTLCNANPCCTLLCTLLQHALHAWSQSSSYVASS